MSIEKTLADTFDIDLSEQQVEDSTARIAEIKEEISKQKYTLEDKEYIRAELQTLIERNSQVLETLSEQCKLGASPRLFEVYSTLSNTISNNLMDLAKLNQTITDYQVTETNENMKKQALDRQRTLAKSEPGSPTTLVQNNTYNFTSNEMLKMLNELNLQSKPTTLESLPKFDLH